ncbi:hypothetical protein BGZ98_002863 [Dissophora globulifera]|nr:hypothetical protein BGZ98_002863 [Dissophora globulifera]
MIGMWAPPSERSKAVATVTAFAYLGSVIALPISSALVVSSWGWRSIFYVFGTVGLVWSAAWQLWGASDPISCRWILDQEKLWILQQQQMDQDEGGLVDGTHPLAQRRESLQGLTDQEEGGQLQQQQQHIRTVDFDGASVTYQSLASTTLQHGGVASLTHVARDSEDSEGDIQATVAASSSCARSGLDEGELVFRSDHTTPSSSAPSGQLSRWQAFRNQLRSRSLDRHGLKSGEKKAAVPWRKLLMRREVWAIILSQSWVPTFYLDFYGVDIGKIGYYAVLPSAAQGIVGLMAGYLGDKATQDWHWTSLTVRRAGQSVGSLGLGMFLIVAVYFAHTAALAMILITIGMALNGFTMIGASAYQHDFCPQHAGFIFSLGNTAGSIPALIGVFVVGVLLDSNGSNEWALIWTAVCAFYVIGTTAFVLLSTGKRFPYTMPSK